MVDRVAIINEDGTFANRVVEQAMTQLIQELLGPIQAPPTLTSYATVQGLEDYPTSFPPDSHAHTLGSISGISTAGQVLLAPASTEIERKSALGLDLVTNTADLDKPVSTAVQAILDTLITSAAVQSLLATRVPTLFASSATTIPARSTVTSGYTGSINVDISRYPRSEALDAAALAVMLNGDMLIRRRA